MAAQFSDLIKIDDSGYIYPEFAVVLETMRDSLREIHGPDIYLGEDSKAGQWVGIFAQAAFDVAQLGAAVYNSFNPATAGIDALRRNIKINGMTPLLGSRSQVDLTLTGAPGTIIEAGVVKDRSGNKWDLPAGVVIPLAGEVIATATAREDGAQLAAINTVTEIDTPVRGWQSVTNKVAATAGRNAETAAEIRERQALSTMLPSLTVLESMQGALESLAGVTRVKIYENDKPTDDTDGLPPHAISAVVEGGDSQAIAETLALKKTPGGPTHGTTTVTLTKRNGITQAINFFRPTPVRIKVVVSVKALQGWLSSSEALMKTACSEKITAGGIGDDVLYTKLFGAVLLAGTSAEGTFDLLSVTVAKGTGPAASANIPLLFNEAAICEVADVTVTVTTA